MEIHLFGAATAAGQSFKELFVASSCLRDIFAYSRYASFYSSHNRLDRYYYLNLDRPKTFFHAGDSRRSKIWISFAPIWKLAPFIEQLATCYPERMQGLCGVIACSSSSSITKRFAFNRFDRCLVSRLIMAEDRLIATSWRISVPCIILQPTMIYGQCGAYRDGNLSRLLQHLRRLPVLPIPAESGLRQPIHVSQLASAVLHLVQQLTTSGWDIDFPQRFALGGDSTLTYTEMIRSLQQAQPPGDPAHRCLLFPIPNRIFFLLAAPLLLRSPKAFEAVLRMGANLSGFTPVHQLLGSEPQPFPVFPLD
jgi:hypothetical protein